MSWGSESNLPSFLGNRASGRGACHRPLESWFRRLVPEVGSGGVQERTLPASWKLSIIVSGLGSRLEPQSLIDDREGVW